MRKPKKYTYIKNTGKAITVPNKDLSVPEALKQYRAGTFNEQIQSYYDTEMGLTPEDKLEYPTDLSKLDKIERLELLSEVRTLNKKYKENLKNINNENERIANEAAAAAAANTGIPTESQPPTTTAT